VAIKQLKMTLGIFKMSDQDWLKLELQSDGVMLVTMQNAPVNAFNPNSLGELEALFVKLAGDGATKAVVLASNLKVFSAGLNLKEAQHYDLAAQKAIVDGFHKTFLEIFAFPKPFIVAVEGAAIAGGFFPVICSDYRIAGPRATFGLAEVRVGVGMPAGLMEIIRSMLSPNDLRRILQNGTAIQADAAIQAGIVDELVQAGDVLGQALKVARDYAQIPPKAYATVKYQSRQHTIEALKAEISKSAAAEPVPWFTEETTSAMAKMIG
jgi:enoyl-CoA hydratase